MKVKLIKNKVDNSGDFKLMNYDLSGRLQLNKSFYVFGVRVESEGTYFYIYDDFYLFPVPSQMFEIIENDIPAQWKITRQQGAIFLCPELFNEPYFFNRFSDHDKELSGKFKVLAAEMYPDFEYEEW